MDLKSLAVTAYDGFARALDMASPLFDLGVRLYVAWQFFKSGLTKIQSWDTTLMLFRMEYDVPLLAPTPAAWLGTAAELGLPVFLALGLAGRLAALSLTLFNIMAVIAYSSFLLAEGVGAGMLQHIMWGVMFLITLFHGPGKLSVDYLLGRYFAALGKR